MIDYRKIPTIAAWLSLDNELDRFDYVTALALATPLPATSLRDSQHRMTECETNTWYQLSLFDTKLHLEVDSDSLWVRGLALLLEAILAETDICTLAEITLDFSSVCYELGYISAARQKGLRGFETAIQKMAAARHLKIFNQSEEKS